MKERLDFAAEVDPVREVEGVEAPVLAAEGAVAGHLFDDIDELPPTWSRDGRIYHTTEKCSRLRAIKRNNRESGQPGLREHCLNCKDILATKRRG